eukprot:SAG22_NODE_17195_length_310_cov_0.545024_1_plen_38_part_01
MSYFILDTARTELSALASTLSLHDPLPVLCIGKGAARR